MTQNDPGNDYPLSEVPMHARKGLASTAMHRDLAEGAVRLGV
jgi:hypothetical protein